MSNVQDVLAANIKRLRFSRGLTQDELAHKAGIAYSTVAKLEQGAIKNPTLATASSIAEALGADMQELFEAGTPSSSKQNKVSFVYFDLNDVLVRFYQNAFTRLSHESGLPTDKIEAAFLPLNEAANKGEMSLGEFNQLFGSAIGINGLDWGKYYLEALEKTPGMSELVTEVSKKVSIGLLTNSLPSLVEAMARKGLIPLADKMKIIDSSVVGATKPEEKIFEEAEKAAGVKAKQILFIDNDRGNLAAAKARGWQTIWFDDYEPEAAMSKIRKRLAS